MEAIIQNNDDHLIEPLNFRLNPGASYITNRRFVSFFPSSASTYSPTNVRVIKLQLNDDNWLDPTTVKLHYTLNNLDGTNPLRTVSKSPNVFFSRARVLMGGQVIQDLQDYNRNTELMRNLMDVDRAANDAIDGFDHYDFQPWNSGGVAAGESTRVSTSLMLGIFNQPKYIPLKYAGGITVELELADQHSPITTSTAAPVLSNDWTISDVSIQCDVVTLDNALDNEYTKKIIDGDGLKISFDSMISQQQSFPVGASQFNFIVSRSVSRLKAVFATMARAVGTPLSNSGFTLVNSFANPIASEADNTIANQHEFQMQIGSKLYPELPINSNASAFSQLRKAIGIHNSPSHSMNISRSTYMVTKYIIGIDTEKVLSASYTGADLRHNDLIVLKYNKMRTGHQVSLAYCLLVHDVVIEIRASGVVVHE